MTYGIWELAHIQNNAMASRDFCSTSADEDYLEIHSPTDNSEDSVEVKVTPIALKNKRKCAEPRKVQDLFSGPLKKRMCLKAKAEISESHPFRPWSPKNEEKPCSSIDQKEADVKPQPSQIPGVINSDISDNISKLQFPLQSFIVPKVPIVVQPITAEFHTSLTAGVTTHKYAYFRPPSPVKIPPEDQPVSLVKKPILKDLNVIPVVTVKRECDSPSTKLIVKPTEVPRVPIHPQIATLSAAETERLIINTNETFPALQSKVKNEVFSSSTSDNRINTSNNSCHSNGSNSSNNNNSGSSNGSMSRREQRNYKNMTRERRIEANARERTRVHTISAAFDTLRKAVPAYSHNQKLSKLSVLRIACSYIMTLSNVLSSDEESVSDSVELVTRTIQREGKLRKKKDDND